MLKVIHYGAAPGEKSDAYDCLVDAEMHDIFVSSTSRYE